MSDTDYALVVGRLREVERTLDLLREGKFTAAHHVIAPLERRRADLQAQLREKVTA